MDNLGIISSFLLGCITILGGVAVSRSQARNYDANTIQLLSKQINDLVKEMDNLRDEFKEYKERFEKHKDRVKDYLSELLKYFNDKGLKDYPQPPDEILDTHPKMKKI